MSKTWNVCIVGLGYWSDVHFEAWRSLGDRVRIAAAVDLDPAKRDAKAARHGIAADRLYARLDDALARPGIEIVDIVTRPDSHLELVERAARAGKHVLCQKPFAPTIEECREMVDVCRKRGVRLMVAEGWRWQAHYMALRRTLDSGALGAVSYAKISAKWFFTPRFADPAKMTQPYFREMERLLMYEMCPHYIDAYQYLFGLPESVTAAYSRVSPHIMGDDLALLVFRHPSMLGLLEAGWASREQFDSAFNLPGGENLMEYVWIEGADASLRLSLDGTIQLIRSPERVENIDYPVDSLQNGHNRLHAHFVDCLESGEECDTSGERYLNVMELIEQAYATGSGAATGR